MTTAAAPRRGSSLTVQAWQTMVLLTMGVLVIAGAVAGGLLLNRTDQVSGQLIDQIQPSRSAAYRLQAALRDQETAVRGYAISADRQFLDPYDAGLVAERQAADDIRQRAGGRATLITDLDAIEAAATSWRTDFAEPVIAGIVPGRPSVVNADLAERGKVDFDRVRALFDVQNQHLTEARATGIDDLNTVRAWRDRVLVGIIVVVVVAAIALTIVMRNAVSRPLDTLAAACRRITQGSFNEAISLQGPKDIRAMATDVDNMRQRIVDELESSKAARAQLVEQADALDEQAIELRRSNAELEQFAYVASHDLQEPLRKVTSFCQLLERRYGDQLDERGLEYIAYAVDGAKRMQILINDLLTFSRVGRHNATYSEVDLDSPLNDAIENLAAALEDSGAEIVRPREPLPHVIGDPTLLGMVWQNLIGNAVKFRREGVAPRIVIEFERVIGEGDGKWLFTTSDNGIGIGEEFVDKVFVIFQRLHGRDAYSGTGIGLALCKKIVEHHGGSIWIDTSYTGGTRFRFTLPISEPAWEHTPAAVLKGTE